MMASEPCIGPWSRGSHLVNGGDLSRSGEKGDRAVSHKRVAQTWGVLVKIGENLPRILTTPKFVKTELKLCSIYFERI